MDDSFPVTIDEFSSKQSLLIQTAAVVALRQEGNGCLNKPQFGFDIFLEKLYLRLSFRKVALCRCIRNHES